MRGAVSTEFMVLFVGFVLASLLVTALITSSMSSYTNQASGVSSAVSQRVFNAAEVVSAFYLGNKTYVLVRGVSGEIPYEKVTVLVGGAPQSVSIKEYKGDGDRLIEKGELFYVIVPYRVDGEAISFQSSTVSANLGVVSNPTEFSLPYRVKVVVRNASGQTPTDYPVRIELNSSNFPMEHIATPDCSDILPVDLNMKLLPFYIEHCSPTRVVLWVKVPVLSPEVNLYILYGRGGLPPESNGHETFNFFDDGEYFSGWIQYSGGEVRQYCGLSFEGRCSLLKTLNNDPSGAYKQFALPLERNFVLEAWINRINLNGGTCDRIGVIDTSGNGYGFVYCHASGIGLGVDRRTNYTPTILVSSDLGTDVTNDWFRAVLIVYGSDVNAEYYYLDTLQDRVSVADTTYASFSSFYIFGGFDYLVDRVIIRKLVLPEPIATILPEETGSFVPQ